MAKIPLRRLRKVIANSTILRFLLSGGVNTALTYFIYLFLLQLIEYKVAYTISYIFGIALSFAINRLFVFQTHRGWRSVIMFPFVYLAQYLTSIVTVWLWVEKFSLPREVAPLIAVAITIPLTFVLSRLVFGSSASRDPAHQLNVGAVDKKC